MAKFIGTEQEFIDLFGPTLLTNAVKSYTPKKIKGETCNRCNRQIELQAAHRRDTPGRIAIASQILKKAFAKQILKLLRLICMNF